MIPRRAMTVEYGHEQRLCAVRLIFTKKLPGCFRTSSCPALESKERAKLFFFLQNISHALDFLVPTCGFIATVNCDAFRAVLRLGSEACFIHFIFTAFMTWIFWFDLQQKGKKGNYLESQNLYSFWFWKDKAVRLICI